MELTDQGMVSTALKTTYLRGPIGMGLPGGNLSNSRYREIVTPLSARKVEPATADVEADGGTEPNIGAGMA